MMFEKVIRLALRLSVSAGFLSAVADRFGMWHYHVAWGTWINFKAYLFQLVPWLPAKLVAPLAILATIAELVLSLFLIIGWKTNFFAVLSGALLLLFALAMTFSTGIKTAFDASVFAAATAAFAIAVNKSRWLELDSFLEKHKQK